MKPKKMLIERSAYSEFFIEIAWKTPSHYDLMDDYIAYWIKTSSYSNRREVVESLDIGITRKELKLKIDTWNKFIGCSAGNEGPSYSKKIKNLIDFGLIKKVDYPFRNKKYRYVINKFKILDLIFSLIITDETILSIFYKDEKRVKFYLKNDQDLNHFDEYIWKNFLNYILKLSRHREDFRRTKLKNLRLIDNLKEEDSAIINCTIKDYIEHFIFYHAMLYFSYISTGKSVKFPGNGSSENRYYEAFLRCCWLYIEHNVFSSWLIAPYLKLTNESPKLEVGRKNEKI